MKSPLISIIVPVYKVEKYLETCVNSIINQTYKNLEIILVDDGSPDNCPQLCDDLAERDSRILVIHKTNGGLSSARNVGIENSKGDFLAFIDSDDIISQRFVEILYGLIRDKNTDISQCCFKKFCGDLSVDGLDSISVNSVVYSALEAQSNRLVRKCANYVIVCNKLYKKTIFDNIRFPLNKIHEDEFTTYKAFDNAQNGVCVTELELYYYRTNENSITNSEFSIKRYDLIDAYEEMIEYYIIKKYDELYEQAVYKYNDNLKMLYLNTYKYINDNRKENLIFIKNKLKENYKRICSLSNVPKKQIMMKFIICNFPFIYKLLFYDLLHKNY